MEAKPTTPIKMKNPDKLEIAYCMQKYGGAFVKALSQVIVLADPANVEKVKAAWPEYWEKYSTIAASKDEQRMEG